MNPTSTTTPNNNNNNNSTNNNTPPPPFKPLKVLFLSSDTGGGHRASATALGVQFQRLFPNSTYHLLDITKEFARPPYNNLQSWYSHLSSNPNQWNLVYKVSNNQVFESVFKIHFKMSTKEAKIRRCIQEYEADVVISVHPLMNDIPLQSCMKISHESNRHLPFFTVVTDLGSGHCTWFEKNVEKMFIASNAIETLARERGNVPKDKLVMSGLPIRYEFAFEAERLGDRTSLEGKIYQLQMRGYLDLFNNSKCCNDDDDYNHNDDVDDDDRKVLLVMGGGEGVGSLSNIVHNLYVHCVRNNIRALILVVCGRNAKLKSSLETCDWDAIHEQELLSMPPQRVVQSSKEQNSSYDEKEEKNSSSQSSVPHHQQEQQQQNQGVTKSITSKVTNMMLSPLKILSLSSFTKIDKNKQSTTTTSNRKDENNDTCTKKPPIKIQTSTIEEEKKESFYDDDDEINNNSNISNNDHSLPSSTRSSSVSSSESIPTSQPQSSPLVIVKPLGFVTNMAEYMVAADILLTKAGPGTIAEAASLGLPVLLTSFLPGQEEGNIDFVIEKKFGEYIPDSNPENIAQTVCSWLNNPDRMKEMSQYATKAGMPNAAEDIVKCIGKSVLRWKELNEEQGGEDI